MYEENYLIHINQTLFWLLLFVFFLYVQYMIKYLLEISYRKVKKIAKDLGI